MKARFMIPMIVAMLLVVIVPSTALVSIISVTVNHGNPVTVGQPFTIDVTAYEPMSNYIMQAISVGRNGQYTTLGCTLANVCSQQFTFTENNPGSVTYTVKGQNNLGQVSSDAVTFNVNGQGQTSTAQTYIFRTVAIDGPAMDNNDQTSYINPTTVQFSGQTKVGRPYATFENIPSNKELNVYYTASTYAQDWDVFFFDSRLPSCTSSGCSFTNGAFTTVCDYVPAPYPHYACTQLHTLYSPIKFDYYPYDPDLDAQDVIKRTNKLYKPGCPIVTGLTNVTFVNGNNFTGLDLDNYVIYSGDKSSLLWTVSKENYVDVSIGMSNIISISALDPNFSGNDVVRFTATNGQCSDSDDLLVMVNTGNQDPTVTIEHPFPNQNFTQNCGNIDFNSTINDPDGTITSISWTYNSATLGATEDISVPASTFANGQNNVRIDVIDNNGGTDSDTVNFNIVAHSDPICSITTPVGVSHNSATYTNYLENTLINFAATAAPTDTCVVPTFQYSWSDNSNTNFNDQQSFSLNNLTPGYHDITLFVADGLGGNCNDQIFINITQDLNNPTAIITSPNPNQPNDRFVYECEQIFFNVTADDADGTIQNILWYLGGNPLQNVQSFYMNASDFNIGLNQVSVTVIDDDNLPGYDSVDFYVDLHTDPFVNITQPIPYPDEVTYYQFPENTPINFNATASATDVCTGDFNYFWRIDGIPIFANTQYFTKNDLSIGLHNITVYATDDFGGESYDFILLNITDVPNIPPQFLGPINCYNDQGGALLSEHDPIFCDVPAVDTNGTIEMWQWTVFGLTLPYNYGPDFNQLLTIPGPNYLDAGWYNVSVIIFDNETPAATAIASTLINVTPNSPPNVVITLPVNDPETVMQFCKIEFNATADDADGYIVPQGDPSYNWRAVLANGTPIDPLTTEQYYLWSDPLPVGLNTFSVSVTDNDGAQGSDSVVINTTRNIRPTVTISVPSALSQYTHTYNRSQGPATVDFDADVTNGFQDDCSDCTLADYTWEWSDDFGSSITHLADTKAFNYDNMAIGVHNIIVQSTDCYGQNGIDTISVNVTELPNQNPVVTIHTPTENQSFIDVCDIITFNTTAYDPDGDDISGWLWTYMSNDISTIPYFQLDASNFSIGNNTVNAYAFDNQTPQGTGSARVSFNVLSHTGPAVTLSLTDVLAGTPILNGSSVNESRSIFFNVTAVPTDLCNADQFNYIWEDVFGSNVYSLPNTQSFTLDNLSIGLHMIRVTAYDDYNEPGTDFIFINITDVPNNPPVVNFTCYDLATGNTTLVEYQPIQCNATGTDPDGDNLIIWEWDVIGDSSASEISLTDNIYILPELLGNGTYNVSLSVFDDGIPTAVGKAINEIVVTNNTPQVILTALPTMGTEPLPVDFNCTITAGTGNADFRYNMSFGGDMGSQVVWPVSSRMLNFPQNYDHNGSFDAFCTVTDMDGDIGISNVITIDVTDSLPTAEFSWTPLNPNEGDLIQFTDLSTAYDMPLTNWDWDFNNNGTVDSTQQNPTHFYPQALTGTFDVNLTVTDSDGSKDSQVHTIIVNETRPTAQIINNPPASEYEGVNITFIGFGTAYDVPVSYSWDFGDGTGAFPGMNIGHVFRQQGNYTVTLTVMDNDGDIAQDTHDIEILDTWPTAVALNDQTIYEGDAAYFNGSLSDAYDQTPNCAAPFTLLYSWDFGDGVGTSNLAEPTYNGYTSQGDYTVNLTVTDCDGSQRSDIVLVHVLDTVPVADAGSGQIVDEGQLVNFNASASIESADLPNSYTWNFSDGTVQTFLVPTATHTYNTTGPLVQFNVQLIMNDTDGSASPPAYTTIFVYDIHPQVNAGTDVTINEGDTVNFAGSGVSVAPLYDPITWFDWNFADGNTNSGPSMTNPSNQYLDNGTYTVNLTVTDEDSSRSALLVVTSNNVPPIADAHGDYSCMITEVLPRQLVGTATDVSPIDQAALTDASFEWDLDYYNISTDFDVNTTGMNPTFMCNEYPTEGLYTIGLRVTDKDGEWTIDTATINVTSSNVNNPPFFNHSIGVETAINNTLFTFDLNATDIDGDNVSYYTDTVLSNLTIDPVTGVLTIIPTALGLYNLNVTACDDSIGFSNNCTSQTLGLNVVLSYADPIADAGGPYVGYNEGDDILFDGTSSYDPDSGAITSWSWNFGDGSPLGSGSTINHYYQDNGTFSVTLTVTDNEGASNSTTISLDIGNLPPNANATLISAAQENQPITITASQNDPGDNDTVFTYSFDLYDNGFDITNNASNIFTFTPVDNGSVNIRVRVTDKDGDSGDYVLTVDITNVNPWNVDSGGPNYACNQGTPITLNGSGTDVSGDTPLSFEWDFYNDGTVDASVEDPTFPCDIPGSHTVNITAYDRDGGSASDTAIVTVTALPDSIVPVVYLQAPADGYSDADGNLQLFYNVTDETAAWSTCYLYTNVTGPWGIVDWQITQNGTTDSFPLFGLVDGWYSWDVQCNDSINPAFSLNGPYSFEVDSSGPADITSPVVNLIQPDGTTDPDGNVQFFYNVTDDIAATLSCDLYTNRSGGMAVEDTHLVTNGNQDSFTILGIADGWFVWNVECDDLSSTPAFAPVDYTFEVDTSGAVDVTPPSVYLISPADSFIDGDGNVQFTYNVTDDMAATLTCSLYANISGPWGVEATQPTFNLATDSFSIFGIADGIYSWDVECNDGTNPAFSLNGPFAIGIDTSAGDITPPVISNIIPATGSTVNSVPFTLSADTNENADCEYSTVLTFVFGTGTPFPTTGGLSHADTTMNLADGSYTYYIKCNDTAGNVNTDANQGTTTFTINTALLLCGDSNLDAGEQCDDGNNINGDLCNATCGNETCGDNTLQSLFEQCDDGNVFGGDGCSAICTIEYIPVTCGDGVIDSGEECDGSNFNGMDCSSYDSFNAGPLACTANCLVNTSVCTGPNPTGWCGDGIINPGESCDGFNLAPITGCSDFGFTGGGSISCDHNCNFNTSLCIAGGANVPPTAGAGPDQDALQGTIVQLDGSGSDDGGDGGALSYNWTQVSGPAVTIADISNPTFNATSTGTYIFQLVVFDGIDYSTPDTVTITVYTIQQSLKTTLGLYNASGDIVSNITAGQSIWALLSIDNMKTYNIPGATSIIAPAGFTILASSDGGIDNTINIPIPAISGPEVWWQLDTTGLGGTSQTISIDTEGINKSKSINII